MCVDGFRHTIRRLHDLDTMGKGMVGIGDSVRIRGIKPAFYHKTLCFPARDLHTRFRLYACTRIRVYAYTRVFTPIRAYTRIYARVYTHTPVYTRIYAGILAYTRVYAGIRAVHAVRVLRIAHCVLRIATRVFSRVGF